MANPVTPLSPLVETKLHIPRSRPSTVPRPRLRERLNRGAETRLTLISAPAGFGKTTLLTQWLADTAGTGRSVAWVSLEESDAQPLAFWTYVVTALHQAVPFSGQTALRLLQSGQALIENVLATLVNELTTATGEVILVLDDYHLVDSPDIQGGLTYLLEHLPSNVHLVISTRADPALPLARLRVRGDLVEIRAVDLRFSLDEISAYLNDIAGLALTPAALAALEGRTEGWIAALQLAALSLQGRSDTADFIAGFAGDDRYVVDYLVEEVLERQPEPVRRFLLETSILDRLSAPLCDNVTGRPGGKAMLEFLEHSNLFVVGLDDNRRWYRYHHLFADVLRAHLLDEQPDDVAALHIRASQWYGENGQQSAAIRHAVTAGDVNRAAELVEVALPALRRDRQEATVLSWLDAIPEEVVQLRPVLAVGFIGALMAGNQFDDVDRRLAEVEECLRNPPAEMVVVDQAELARLPGAIQTFRAALSLVLGDPAATVRHARLGIERAADGDHLIRAAASGILGLTLWSGGELEAAAQAYAVCIDGLRRAGHIADILGCSIALADIRITQGRLTEARRTYEQAAKLATTPDGDVLRGAADMYVGLSQLACEQGDLVAATRQLQRAEELGEESGLPQNAYRSRVALARVRQGEGSLAEAVTLLEEAERVYIGDFSPDVRPIAAVKVGVLLQLGRLEEALDWTRAQGLSAADELDYLHEYQHIALARILLAQGRRDETMPREVSALLERLIIAAEAGGRSGNLLEMLILQAQARQADGDLQGAVVSLERALTLGEPDGYVQAFAEAGTAISPLLRSIGKRRPEWTYLRRLLGALDERPEVTPTGGLIDPLSARELDVLRLLGTELTGPEIARTLSVSLNTVRTHTKGIYAKLDVKNRRAAVRRGAELDLLRR